MEKRGVAGVVSSIASSVEDFLPGYHTLSAALVDNSHVLISVGCRFGREPELSAGARQETIEKVPSRRAVGAERAAPPEISEKETVS